MSCILIRCTHEKNLELQSLVQSHSTFCVSGFGPQVAKPRIRSDLLLLLQCSLLPGGIILQGVLLLQGYMSVFACHYG
jgi:hypothetical protein